MISPSDVWQFADCPHILYRAGFRVIVAVSCVPMLVALLAHYNIRGRARSSLRCFSVLPDRWDRTIRPLGNFLY